MLQDLCRMHAAWQVDLHHHQVERLRMRLQRRTWIIAVIMAAAVSAPTAQPAAPTMPCCCTSAAACRDMRPTTACWVKAGPFQALALHSNHSRRTASVPPAPISVSGTVGRPGVLASVVRPVKAASPPSTATAG